MARRKIVLAMMMHETNTFSPVPTPLESFRPLAGEAAIAELKDTNTQFGGFLDIARREDAEVVVPFAGGAHPSGYVEKGVSPGELVDLLRQAQGRVAAQPRFEDPFFWAAYTVSGAP
jgi:microcystin degradation protein MlrC